MLKNLRELFDCDRLFSFLLHIHWIYLVAAMGKTNRFHSTDPAMKLIGSGSFWMIGLKFKIILNVFSFWFINKTLHLEAKHTLCILIWTVIEREKPISRCQSEDFGFIVSKRDLQSDSQNLLSSIQQLNVCVDFSPYFNLNVRVVFFFNSTFFLFFLLSTCSDNVSSFDSVNRTHLLCYLIHLNKSRKSK